MTLVSDLISQTRKKSDMEGTDFVTDTEIMGLLNEAQNTLFDTIVLADESFFATETTLTITGAVCALPASCYKLVGLDLVAGGRSRTLRRTTFAMRNSSPAGVTSSNPMYYVKGNNIHFVPTPNVSTATLHYIPNITEFTALTDAIIEPINHWRQFLVYSAAVQCLIKEESSPTAMMANRDAALEQIKQAVKNRDYAEAQSITDIYGMNPSWGDNWDV